MPKSALSKNFCMFLRNIFVHSGRGEMHFKKITRMAVFVCVVEENGLFVSVSSKYVINTERKTETVLLFLPSEEREPYFK